jgi:S1-C subfamily serine protease
MIMRKASRILAALLLAAGASPVAAQGPRACMGIMIGPDPDGVIITDVSANGPADVSWLRAGDVIQGMIIGGKSQRAVRTTDDLMKIMSQLSPGDTVMVRFERGKRQHSTQVTLRPEPMRNRTTTN